MASEGYTVRRKHLVQAFPERQFLVSLTSTKKQHSEAYLDPLKICDGLANVPCIVLETIYSEPNVETRKSADFCDE